MTGVPLLPHHPQQCPGATDKLSEQQPAWMQGWLSPREQCPWHWEGCRGAGDAEQAAFHSQGSVPSAPVAGPQKGSVHAHPFPAPAGVRLPKNSFLTCGSITVSRTDRPSRAAQGKATKGSSGATPPTPACPAPEPLCCPHPAGPTATSPPRRSPSPAPPQGRGHE